MALADRVKRPPCGGMRPVEGALGLVWSPPECCTASGSAAQSPLRRVGRSRADWIEFWHREGGQRSVPWCCYGVLGHADSGA